MKQIVANQKVKIPDGLTVHVKSRLVTVKGPRGILKRNFKHLAVDIRMVSPRLLKVEKWFGSKKELAAVRTVCSHVENMIKGMLVCVCDVKVMKTIIQWDLGLLLLVKKILGMIKVRIFLPELVVYPVAHCKQRPQVQNKSNGL